MGKEVSLTKKNSDFNLRKGNIKFKERYYKTSKLELEKDSSRLAHIKNILHVKTKDRVLCLHQSLRTYIGGSLRTFSGGGGVLADFQ